MFLPCRVEGIETAITGYVCRSDTIYAVVVWQDPNSYVIGARDVPLSMIEFVHLPEKLRRNLKKQDKKNKKAVEADSDSAFHVMRRYEYGVYADEALGSTDTVPGIHG